MAAKNTLTVKILSPTQTIYDGEALSISSANSLGKFDILPYHANFITLVQNTPIVLRVKKKEAEQESLLASMRSGPAKAIEELFGRNIQELKYQFDLAIVFAKDNLVKIYTHIQPQF